MDRDLSTRSWARKRGYRNWNAFRGYLAVDGTKDYVRLVIWGCICYHICYCIGSVLFFVGLLYGGIMRGLGEATELGCRGTAKFGNY